jgi:hypothetical protein
VRAVDKSYAIRWDMDTGRPVDRTEEPEDWRRDDLSPAVRSPDGRWRAQAGKVSRVGGTEEMQLVPPDESLMMTATFSADSRLVASPRTPRAVLTGGPPDGGLVVFDLEIKARVAELPTGQVIHYAFTPDGKQVVVIGRDETVLWDLASGKPSRRYRSGHTNHLRAVAVAFTPNGRRLITGHDDCTALVWDLTGTGRISRKDAPELSADALARLWDDLAGDDAGKAHTAGWELADRPERAVALLRERVKPVRSADDAAVRGLVAKLDVPAFATREAAEKQLRELGETAVPALRAALKAGVSDEQKVRVDRLLAAAATPVIGPGDRLRQLRAVAVLERAGTDDARKLLDELAGGLSEARLTREAAAAIRRLSVPKP